MSKDKTTEELQQAAIDKITQEYADKGKLIEAGFAALRMMAIDPAASQVQVSEMRMAFFAGAQHLFGSILNFLGEGEEPTDKDISRLDLIQQELEEFIDDFKRKHVNKRAMETIRVKGGRSVN